MASTSSPTTFADIHPHIIQAHILPRLDGSSLSAAATASSYLQTLITDHNLWSHVCKSTWPSVTDPRVDHVISTFPDGHRSFFEDSFPVLITEVDHHGTYSNSRSDCSSSHPGRSSHPWPSELISAVDIRYEKDIIFSGVKFTGTTTDFLSTELRIELNDDPPSNRSGSQSVPGISRSIDFKVDELVSADDATISYLKESVTLSWILIDPTRKRAVNLSSIKPVLAWITNDIHLRYVTVLPGYDPNEMVQCRIEVRLGVGKGGVGLHVSKVMLHMQDLVCNPLSGKEFLVITSRAILEENDTRRKKVSYNEPKEMGREKMEWAKKEEKNQVLVNKLNCIMVLLYLLLSVYLMAC